MTKTLTAQDRIPGARKLSSEELQLLIARRQAVLELMREGRDLFLKNEVHLPRQERIAIIRAWIGQFASRDGKPS